MGGVQAHGTGHALELHRADLAEGHVRPAGGVDYLLVTSTSPWRAYSAMREATFTVWP